MSSRGKTSVRIIGGDWNSRKIRIPATAALRPSSDRLRESLFNHLGSTLRGTHCLDLFAGSGALGLCAASHGAAHVTFVEKNRRTAAALKQVVAALTDRAAVIAVSAQRFLADRINSTPFDIVFLDPPFSDYPHDSTWQQLLATLLPHLHTNARVYCESNRHPQPPADWQQTTARRSGSVYWQILTPPARHD